MSKAFGEHAKSANQTFQGALKNTKAALSRIGQVWFDPLHENMRRVLNAITPMINAINRQLKGFFHVYETDDQGRDVLVRNKLEEVFQNAVAGFAQIARALEPVLRTIAKAFKMVFGTLDSDRLVALTETFLSFTEALKVPTPFLEHLGAIFVSFFQVIRAGLQVFGAVAKGFFQLVFALKPLADAFLYLLSSLFSFGAYLTNPMPKALRLFRTIIEAVAQKLMTFTTLVSKGLVRIFDFLVPKIHAVVAALKPFYLWLKEKVHAVIVALTPVFQKLWELLHRLVAALRALWGPLRERISAVAKTLIEQMKPALQWLLQTLNQAIDRLTTWLQKMTSVWGNARTVTKAFGDSLVTETVRVKTFAAGLTDGITNVKSALKDDGKTTVLDRVSRFDWVGAAKSLASLLSGTGFVLFGKAMLGFSNSFKGVTTKLVGSVSGLIRGIGGVLKAYKNTLNAQTILALAKTLALFVGSVVLLGLVDSEKIQIGLLHLGESMLLMMVVLKQMIRTLKDTSGLQVAQFAGALGLLAGAILLLSSALKKLAKIPAKQIAIGTLALSAMLLVMPKSLEQLSKTSSHLPVNPRQFKQISHAVLVMSAAIWALSNAIKIAAKIPAKQMVTGVAGLAAMLLMLSLSLKHLSQTAAGFRGSQYGKIATALLMMSATMVVLSTAIRRVAKLPIKSMSAAMVGLSVLFVAMTATLSALTRATSGVHPVKFISAAGVMLVLASTMVLLSKAVQAVAKLPIKSMSAAMVGLGGLLLILATTLGVLTKVTLGVQPLHMAAIAASLLLLSAALLPMAAALKLLGTLRLGQIGLALLALAGSFAVLGVAGLVLGPLSPILIVLAGALGLVGAAVLGVGAGFSLAASGISLFASLGSTAVNSVKKLGRAMISLLPELATTLGISIHAFVVKIAELSPEMSAAILTAIEEFLDTARDKIPKIAEFFVDLVLGVLTVIDRQAQTIVDALVNLLLKVIDMLNERAPELVSALTKAIKTILSSVFTELVGILKFPVELLFDKEKMNETAPKVAKIFKSETSKTRDELGESIQKWFDAEHISAEIQEDLMKAFKNGFGASLEDFKKLAEQARADAIQTGACLGDGVIKGADSKLPAIEQSGQRAYKAYDAGVRKAGEIHSPSRVMQKRGQQFVAGLVQGSKKSEPDAHKAGGHMGQQLTTGLKDSLADIGTSWSQDLIDRLTEQTKPLGNSVKSSLTPDVSAPLAESVATSVKKAKPKVRRAMVDLSNSMLDAMTETFRNSQVLVADQAFSLGQSAVEHMIAGYKNEDLNAATQAFMRKYHLLSKCITTSATELNKTQAKQFARDRLLEEARAYDDGIRATRDAVFDAEKRLADARQKAREEVNKESIRQQTKTAAQVAIEEVRLAEKELQAALQSADLAKKVETAAVDELIQGIEGVVPGVDRAGKEAAVQFALDWQDRVDDALHAREGEMKEALQDTFLGALTGFGGENVYDLSRLGVQFSEEFMQGFLDGTKGGMAAIGDVIANKLDNLSNNFGDAGQHSAEKIIDTIDKTLQLKGLAPFLQKGIKMGAETAKGFLKGLSKGTRTVFEWVDKIARRFGEQILKTAEDVLGKLSDMTANFAGLGVDFGADFVNWILTGAQGELPSIGALLGSMVSGSTAFLDIGASIADGFTTALLTAFGLAWLAPFAKIGTNLAASLGKAFVGGLAKIVPNLYDFVSRSIFRILPESWQKWITEIKQKIQNLIQTIFGTTEEAAGTSGDSELKWIRQHGKQLGVIYLDALEELSNDTQNEKEDMTKGITDWIHAIAEALRAFGPVGAFFADILEKISSAIQTVGRWIQSLFEWITQPLSSVFRILKKVGNGLLSGFQWLWDGFWGFGKGVVSWFVKGFQSVGTGAFSSWVKAVWLTITGGWKKIWRDLFSLGKRVANWFGEGFRSLDTNNFSTWITSVCHILSNGWNGMLSYMFDIGKSVVTWFHDGFHSLGTSTFGTWVSNVLSAISSEISNIWSSFESAGTSIWNYIYDGMNANTKSGSSTIISNIFSGLSGAVSSLWNSIKELGKSIGEAILSGIKAFLGIKSPSKEFYQVGVFSIQGLCNAIYDNEHTLEVVMQDAASKMIDTMDSALQDSDAFTITPVLDLSDISRDKKGLSQLLSGTKFQADMEYSSKLSQICANELSRQSAKGSMANPVTNIEFVQNNSSPKALTTVDIYRQTNNAISILKRKVGMT